jgi:hypothetical protein
MPMVQFACELVIDTTWAVTVMDTVGLAAATGATSMTSKATASTRLMPICLSLFTLSPPFSYFIKAYIDLRRFSST